MSEPEIRTAAPLDVLALPPAATTSSPGGRWVGYLFVALVSLALWAPRLGGPIDLRYDAGVYFVLGVSIAEGHGYRITSEPGAPEAVQYPPALPAFVALHAKILGTTDPLELGRWLRRSYFLLFLCFAFSVLALARRFLPAGWAAVATCLCLLQLNTYLLSDLLFSELPFALVSVLLILHLTRKTQPTAANEGVGFLLASLGFLVRSAGLALLAAWICDAALRRHWRVAALRALLSAVPFAAWQLHVSQVRRSAEYTHPAYAYQRAPYQFYNVTYAENIALIDPFRPELGKATARDLVRRFAVNVAAIPSALGEAVSATLGFWRWGLNELQDAVLHRRPVPEWVVTIPVICLAIVSLVGVTAIAAGGSWAFAAFLALSVGLVCVTPWPGQFSRYVSPLVPFLSIATFVGSLWIRGKSTRGYLGTIGARSVTAALATLAVLTFAIQVFTGYQIFVRRQSDSRMASYGRGEQHHVFYHSLAWDHWEEAVSWIRQHASRDAVVATVAPQLCYLWTGLHSIFPPMESNPKLARSLMESVPVSYVIIDELEFLDTARTYGRPALESAGSAWRLAFERGGTQVYFHESSSEKAP